MNGLLKRLVAALPGRLAERVHGIKHRLYWRTRGATSHLDYFDAYQTRTELLSVLRDWLATQPPRRRLRVLEFGCSGGNNLLLLRELLEVPVEYVGMDLLPDAVAFAQGKFPDDRFVVGDDATLARLAPTLGHFDVFIAAGVLHYLPPARCQTVLDCARTLADAVLVCDDLTRFESIDGANDGLFLHPYQRMCAAAGLSVLAPPVPLTGSRYGVFLAAPVGN